MSTILDALKKLERDKHVDEAHARPPDPLAPAPEPALSPEDVTGRNMGWMAAGVALTFVIGIGIGVATFSDGGEDASIEAAGVLATPPAVAAPARDSNTMSALLRITLPMTDQSVILSDFDGT